MEAQTNAIRPTDVTAEPRHSSPDIAPPRNGKKPSRVDLPGYTYAELITMAIQSSPSRMMTIVDIQQFFRDRFPCFRTSYKGWHNSIRHNLSARECFYKVFIFTINYYISHPIPHNKNIDSPWIKLVTCEYNIVKLLFTEFYVKLHSSYVFLPCHGICVFALLFENKL